MRTIALLPAAAIVAALLGGGPETIPEPRSNLERATRLLFDGRPSDADAKAGILALLDAVSEAAPASRIAGDWPARVGRARALFEKCDGVDEEAATLLLESYRQVTGGTDYRFPASVHRIEDAVGQGRLQLEGAAEALRAGRNGDAVRLLLETVLLIVTPVHV